MAIPTNIDDYQLNLFSPVPDMQKRHVPQPVIDRLLRLRCLYTVWLNFPTRTTKEMVYECRSQFPEIKEREAYDDIKLIKILIGNIEQESKEWQRHVFNERTNEVYRRAMAAKDYRAAEKANADFAKYNRLGELDQQPIDYDDIKPHIIEPTDDPTVIGIKPVKDLRNKIKKLKKRFGADISDVDFIEINDDNNGSSEQEENLPQ